MFFALFVLSIEARSVGVVFGGPAVQLIRVPLSVAKGSIVSVVNTLSVLSALKPVALVVVSVRVDHPALANGLIVRPVAFEYTSIWKTLLTLTTSKIVCHLAKKLAAVRRS